MWWLQFVEKRVVGELYIIIKNKLFRYSGVNSPKHSGILENGTHAHNDGRTNDTVSVCSWKARRYRREWKFAYFSPPYVTNRCLGIFLMLETHARRASTFIFKCLLLISQLTMSMSVLIKLNIYFKIWRRQNALLLKSYQYFFFSQLLFPWLMSSEIAFRTKFPEIDRPMWFNKKQRK